MGLKDNSVKPINIEEVMEVFFSNPSNRLIMAMLGVHDGDMTVKEAVEFAKNEHR